MTPDDPRHGEHRGYYAHIRAGQKPCDPCHEAFTRHRRRRGKLRTRGIPGRLPIGEKIHARLRAARDRGMTHQDIATAVGVSLSCAWRYCEEGPDFQVSYANWKKLATFRPHSVLTHTGLVRRIQALHHLGYGCVAIAAEANCSHESLQEAIRGREYTSMRLRVAVAEAFDRLWATPCQASRRVTSRAKNRALNNNWAPALAWDEGTIDDPNAQPAGLRSVTVVPDELLVDDAAILRRMAGDRTVRLSAAEQAEVVHRLLDRDWSYKAIEDHTGLNSHRVIREERARLAAADQGEAAA